MLILMKHPYSGLYWTQDLVERYACLGNKELTLDEAVEELEESGFERVWPEDIEADEIDEEDRFDRLCQIEAPSRFSEVVTSSPTMEEMMKCFLKEFGQLVRNSERTATILDGFTKTIPLLTPPLGVQNVAKLAGVQSKAVYRWKAEGLLKPLSDNRPLLFDQAEVRDFLSRRRRVNP